MSRQDKWRAFVNSIPGIREMHGLAAPEPPKSDGQAAYLSLLEKLPSSIADVLREEGGLSAPSLPPASRVATWCFADMPEGDFPRVHAFTSLAGLLKALAAREGSDTAVWPFYGFPFRLTKLVTGPDGVSRRYLQLDTTTAVVVASGPSVESVPMSSLASDVEFEDEGWLGDPDLRRKTYFCGGFVETGDADGSSGSSSASQEE